MVAFLLRGGGRARQEPGVRSRSSAAGPMPSWSTGCGRNMSAAFPITASGRRRGSIANVMTSMLDLMPAPGLIFAEWDKHGTCSGLGARAYFETIRKARAAVKISAGYSPCIVGRKDPRTGRDRGRLHQGQSGPERGRDRGGLRPQAAQRGADLHEQGSPVPRLRGDRPPRLPARRGGDAADEGGHRATSVLGRHCEGNPATEAIQPSLVCVMDCFAEPVIGRAFCATRWLAMTGLMS